MKCQVADYSLEYDARNSWIRGWHVNLSPIL